MSDSNERVRLTFEHLTQPLTIGNRVDVLSTRERNSLVKYAIEHAPHLYNGREVTVTTRALADPHTERVGEGARHLTDRLDTWQQARGHLSGLLLDEVAEAAERIRVLEADLSAREAQIAKAQAAVRFQVTEFSNDAAKLAAFERVRRILSAAPQGAVEPEKVACPRCGVEVSDQTPSAFYARHDEMCGGPLEEPQQGAVDTHPTLSREEEVAALRARLTRLEGTDWNSPDRAGVPTLTLEEVAGRLWNASDPSDPTQDHDLSWSECLYYAYAVLAGKQTPEGGEEMTINGPKWVIAYSPDATRIGLQLDSYQDGRESEEVVPARVTPADREKATDEHEPIHDHFRPEGAAMTTNMNGQRIMLHTDYGAFDTVEDADRAEWLAKVNAERRHQIEEHGYTAEHDREHGADHLLAWAIDYARRGERVKSSALIQAARELLDSTISEEADHA